MRGRTEATLGRFLLDGIPFCVSDSESSFENLPVCPNPYRTGFYFPNYVSSCTYVTGGETSSVYKGTLDERPNVPKLGFGFFVATDLLPSSL